MADSFKVLIVGGSVAGMALANMLERYNIEYELFEKHEVIAPQLGASIAILAHGSRILEQLDCLDTLETISSPLNKIFSTGPDGHQISHHAKFGDYMEELIGHRMRFLDRRQLIQTLYDKLKDKSRVHKSSEISKIEMTDSSVFIKTKNGTTTRGSILVGADGVHSRVREEMWRIADIEKPGYISAAERNCITCTYSCMFGISQDIESIKEDEGFKAFHDKRSYLYQGGPGGKVYWFFFLKNKTRTIRNDIPRYNKDDEKFIANKYASDSVGRGLTFGDLYQQRQTAVFVPLEEYVLRSPFYKRVILVGDSYHKMNPLTGQGGNAAIESAACLSDLIADLLETTSNPDLHSIQDAFTIFRDTRGPRAAELMKAAEALQKLESLDNFALKFLNLNILSKFDTVDILKIFVQSVIPARSLRRLPAPRQLGLLQYQDNLSVKPHKRPLLLTVIGMLMLAAVVLVPTIFRHKSLDVAPAFELSDFYSYMSKAAISLVWIIEASRPMALLTPLGSAFPFAMASQFFDWDLVVLLYCLLHIFKSRELLFYFPSPREINLSTAKAIPAGVLFTSFFPLLKTILPFTIKKLEDKAQLVFPIAIIPIAWVLSKTYSSKTPATAFVGSDLPYILRSYHMMIFITSTTHIIYIANLFQRRFAWMPSSRFFVSQKADMIPPTWALLLVMWCIFTAWDMRRINASGRFSIRLIWLAMLATSILLGPGTLLVGTWRWREIKLEKARMVRRIR